MSSDGTSPKVLKLPEVLDLNAASRLHEAAGTLITTLLLGAAVQLDGERSSALTHARWHPWRRHHGGTGCRRQ